MKTAPVLEHLLAETRDEELDCDRVLELLPPYLDGRVDRATLREQIEHHTKLCPECAEELAILRRALDR